MVKAVKLLMAKRAFCYLVTNYKKKKKSQTLSFASQIYFFFQNCNWLGKCLNHLHLAQSQNGLYDGDCYGARWNPFSMEHHSHFCNSVRIMRSTPFAIQHLPAEALTVSLGCLLSCGVEGDVKFLMKSFQKVMKFEDDSEMVVGL